MLIDGKKIAEEIYGDIRTRLVESIVKPTLGILTCAPNFETEKYLTLKQKRAAEVGIRVTERRQSETASTDDMERELQALISLCDGVVVQLPLPPHIDRDRLLAHIPASHDVDALGPGPHHVPSPVVGAIEEILKRHEVPIIDRHVVVVGSGKLVGIPVSSWFSERGASVSIVTKDTIDISFYTKNADIVVSGAGVPGLITKDMVKEGVVILDAGTSEDGGVLRGDVDPNVLEKASLLTPVPGGIGPITIAVLLRNVVKLSE